MTQSVFDPSRLEELLDLGAEDDRGFVGELVEVFLDSARSRVDQILAAATAGDCQRIEQAAHSIKGSAANLGVVEMAQLAEALQVAGRDSDTARIAALTPEICAALDAASAALHAFVAGLR